MDYFSGLHFPNSNGRKNFSAAQDAHPIYYGIQYVYDGRIALRIDRRRWFEASGPVVFLTTPDYNYEYLTPDGETREHYWVCFHGPRTAEYVKHGLFQLDCRNPLIHPRNPEAFLLHMKELIAASSVEGDYARSVWLQEGALLALRERGDAPGPGKPHLAEFQALHRRIVEHPERHWDMAREARAMSVTLNHFNRLFRSFYRDSPLQFVLGCRLRRAARMLVNSDDSIAEIARQCGFADEFYFSRLFRRHYSHAPREYRRHFHVRP